MALIVLLLLLVIIAADRVINSLSDTVAKSNIINLNKDTVKLPPLYLKSYSLQTNRKSAAIKLHCRYNVQIGGCANVHLKLFVTVLSIFHCKPLDDRKFSRLTF